ncbi:MAG: hypothetical protein COA62_01420 [Rhodobiaceae bacterium]|nr:MAG: hypothetical protein COA62_01420 [Rhodobiaceae bacterium]
MEVDFTQWWVPAVTMIVLGTYVFMSALRESRLPMPAVSTEVEDAASKAGSSSKANKRGFLFRTSWIWGSVLVGVAAQVYLSYIIV